MNIIKKYRIYDKFRNKEIKNILSIHLDREGQINLITYTDKKIKQPLPIKSTNKIFCNEFEIVEVE